MASSAKRDLKTGKWMIQYRFTDWRGRRKKSTKRGFRTKKEAEEWLQKFLITQQSDINMLFGDFIEIYYKDMSNRLREHTMQTKRYIIDIKILPYFASKKINEITPVDVRKWQNELLKQNYKPTYIKTINNQLSAIFNYAEKYYNLPNNPARKAGSIGKSHAEEMQFWTQEEFTKFDDALIDKRQSYIAFKVLYWTGMRLGDDDDKIRLNQRKPSKYKGLSRFGPEKNLQRINKFMKERPIFYKNLIQMKENFRFYLRCFYCITKVVILQFNSENRTELARNG
ncbi:Arm DNA-binding domain-containing protein [Mediterraneibacter gnavus]|uniref:Arm DNA-binding domain-containing protein n=1 Tax=Mediterraneibacter gnavus TaxID=33038 RepID=UPI0036D22516